jgi:hypothetical protein
MILHTDAKRKYRLINSDFKVIKLHELNFKAHGRICSKYFVSEIEKVTISKFANLTDEKSKKFLNKIQLESFKRLEYISRCIDIKKHLLELIEKTFPEIKYNITDGINNKITIMAKGLDTTYAIATMIYAEHLNEIKDFWLSSERKIFVDNLFLEKFGSGWKLLCLRDEYKNLLDPYKSTNEQVLLSLNNDVYTKQMKLELESKKRITQVNDYINANFKRFKPDLKSSNLVQRYIKKDVDIDYDFDKLKDDLNILYNQLKRQNNLIKYITNRRCDEMMKGFYFNISNENILKDAIISNYLDNNGNLKSTKERINDLLLSTKVNKKTKLLY